jgi:DNA-binding NarL/FixJ family response regulator
MRFLVVDDHAMVREGLAAVLRKTWAQAEVLLAPTCETALAVAADAADIDLVILDLHLPDSTGLDTLSAFGDCRPDLPIIILTASEDPEYVRAAFARGALGYAPKSAPTSTLIAAINLVLSGSTYVPTFMVGAPTQQQPRAIEIRGLTPRQSEVLEMISTDVGNKEISRRLNISERTVKAHLTTIFRVLNVSDRRQAARIYRDMSRDFE